MYKQFNRAEDAIGCSPAFDKREFRGHRGFHPYMADMSKAPISIYKTEDTYEVLVFAPGRSKENFKVNIKGEVITINYKPTEDTSSLAWIRKEYSRGGFERSFMVDETVDTENIIAQYEDGVLKLSLSIKPGTISGKQEITVN